MMSDQPCMAVAVVDKTERLTSFAVLSVIAADGKQWLEQFRRNRVFIYDFLIVVITIVIWNDMKSHDVSVCGTGAHSSC